MPLGEVVTNRLYPTRAVECANELLIPYPPWDDYQYERKLMRYIARKHDVDSPITSRTVCRESKSLPEGDAIS